MSRRTKNQHPMEIKKKAISDWSEKELAKGVKQPAPYVDMYNSFKGSAGPRDRTLAGICCSNCKNRGQKVDKYGSWFMCDSSGAEVWFRARCNRFELATGKRLTYIEKQITTTKLAANPYWKKYWYGSHRGINSVITLGRCCRNCKHVTKRKTRYVQCTQRTAETWHLGMCKKFKVEDRPAKLRPLTKYMGRSGADISNPASWITRAVTQEMVRIAMDNAETPEQKQALEYYRLRNLNDREAHLNGEWESIATITYYWERKKLRYQLRKKYLIHEPWDAIFIAEQKMLGEMLLEKYLEFNKRWNSSTIAAREAHIQKVAVKYFARQERLAERRREIEAFRRKIMKMNIGQLWEVEKELDEIKGLGTLSNHMNGRAGKRAARAQKAREMIKGELPGGYGKLFDAIMTPDDEWTDREAHDLLNTVKHAKQKLIDSVTDTYQKGWGYRLNGSQRMDIAKAHLLEKTYFMFYDVTEDEADFLGRLTAYNTALEYDPLPVLP